MNNKGADQTCACASWSAPLLLTHAVRPVFSWHRVTDIAYLLCTYLCFLPEEKWGVALIPLGLDSQNRHCPWEFDRRLWHRGGTLDVSSEKISRKLGINLKAHPGDSDTKLCHIGGNQTPIFQNYLIPWDNPALTPLGENIGKCITLTNSCLQKTLFHPRPAHNTISTFQFLMKTASRSILTTASAWRGTNTPSRCHFLMYKNNLSDNDIR